MQNDENKEVCSACGGVCCKSSGGLVYPNDFGEINLPRLIESLKSGYYAVDYFDDRTNEMSSGYYLRTRVVGVQRAFHPNGLGVCILLNETGCKLNYNNRPTGCKALIPNPPNCYYPNNEINVKSCAIAWQPYEQLVEQSFRIIDSD